MDSEAKHRIRMLAIALAVFLALVAFIWNLITSVEQSSGPAFS